ncbi:MAG: DUF3617 family protein [Acidobacteriaceae bacterium]|nr:DUF3617 family protein [Acidobacteriaceae bacterium]
MRNSRAWILFGFWLCAEPAMLSAGTRKAGLWEMTTTTTWQKAPSIPGAETTMVSGEPHTTQVCLTQEMIDEYGALLPHSRGQCTIANKIIATNRVSADYVCKGTMSGLGTLESKWSDSEHEKGAIHFVGTVKVGAESQAIEWTTVTTTVFKSADCGEMKPQSLPKPR